MFGMKYPGKITMKLSLIAALVAVAGGANAAMTEFDEVKTRCKIVADRFNDDLPGRESLAGEFRHAKDYDQCLVIHGFTQDPD
jgi:hypothetical protein